MMLLISGGHANLRWSHKIKYGKGRVEDDEGPSLYAQYVAMVEQLPTEQEPGFRENKRIARVDFDRWSQKRKLQELQSIGIAVDNSEEATKLFVRSDEGIYPQTHTDVKLPDITPKTLNMADLLHHQHHMTNKLSRLRVRLRELKWEGRMMLQTRRREMAKVNDARFLSQGVGRTRMIYEAHRAIRKHEKLLGDIEKTMKVRIKGFQRDNTQRYLDPDREAITIQKGIHRDRTRRKRAHCRHHVRLPKFVGTKSLEVNELPVTAEQ